MATGNTDDDTRARAMLKHSGPGAHLWVPGQSGNPSGIPALVRRFRALCRAAVLEGYEDENGDPKPPLWHRLLDHAANGDRKSSLTAISLITAYGFGMPTQKVEVDVDVSQSIDVCLIPAAQASAVVEPGAAIDALPAEVEASNGDVEED